MSNQIPTHYAQLFTDGIQLNQQQKESRLRGAVRVEMVKNGDRAFFDKLATTTMTQITDRHANTALTDTPHERRMVTTDLYGKADMIDKRDEVRILNNPINAYTQTYAHSANRQIDATIIASFFANANTGTGGGTSTIFDTNFSIAAGGSGMTLGKIVEARKKLVAAENDQTQPWYMVHSAEQLEDILNDSTITSADYNSVRMLMSGDIDTFMGFKWISSELLGVDGSSARRCCAFARDSILLGIAADVNAEIDRIPSMNHGLQVAFTVDIGATRMDEVGVIEVLCVE